MKHLSCLAIIILLFASGCSPKMRTYSSQISVLPQTEEGTIFLRVSGLGSDERRAYEGAIYNAFSTILYQGVPESIQSSPMIPPENAAKARPKVDNCLHDNNCYKNYITQVTPPGTTEKVRGGYSATIDIKINLHALNDYLIQNNIIRKFGF
jgi:hypothetical protein